MEKAKLKNYKLKDVWIHDTFWDKYINLVGGNPAVSVGTNQRPRGWGRKELLHPEF